MKSLKIIFLYIIGVSLFTSCEKDKDTANIPPSAVQGTYKGKYGTGNNSPSSFYSLNIKSNGVLEELSSGGAVLGVGSWTISGNTFKGTYLTVLPAAGYSVKATLDLATNRLTGTWGYGSSDSDGGKWFMIKE